ncbi:hypothetical protein D9611_005241 [Ephemerocybe angulata]|uniref:Fe2OG dioxygenase domain-containing protein n=1 Tax=Ephemerocybe angulata TaxID=980116 RepID=A0A8H5FD99_9AGAR|nr:hypothetical protein D9611_005241 [Tulosesus angulatus]
MASKIPNTDSSPKAKSLDDLKKTVQSAVTPSYCYGTLPLSPSGGSLFFKKDEASDARYINFGAPNSKDEDILKLVEVSQRATFGRGDKDVLDESYRKAWKLDPTQFSTQFDVVRSGVLEIVHDQLLHYEKNTLPLEAELYKLNVYGPGSFFKPHIDTPRSDKLFATLVVVLPTVHTGGNLLLGKDGSILNFDSAKLVYGKENKEPQIAWAAFYSDIEHQVLPVEDGYRVTLTYNLHLPNLTEPKGLAFDSCTAVVKALSTFIATPTILPTGGALGFGLMYKYPIDPTKADLTKFTGALKGNDAMIRDACLSVGLTVAVKVLYYERDRYLNGSDAWITDDVKTDDDIGWDTESSLRSRFRGVGKRVVTTDIESKSKSERKIPTVWVTPPNSMLTTNLAFATYGNEPSVGYMYGDLVLIATLPAYKERIHAMLESLGDKVDTTSLREKAQQVLEEMEEDEDESDDEDEDMDSDSDGYY